MELNVSSESLLQEVRDGVMWITLNRSEARNALTDAMCTGLVEACQRAADDSTVRAVAIRGAGTAFCAGGDVKAMAAVEPLTAETSAKRSQEIRGYLEAARLLHEMPKPTVAVIRGPAAGGGFSLSLACDFRICTPRSKLTTAFAKVALSGDYGGSYFLPRIVGLSRAKDLYFFSPVLSGEDAYRIGLVNRVFDEDSFERESQAFVQELADSATTTLAYMKSHLNQSYDISLSEALDQEAVNHVRCKLTEDHIEAASAFVEKRKPRFVGR